MRNRWMLCLPFVLLGADVVAQVVAVPPAAHRASPVVKAEHLPSLLTPANVSSMTIALPAPTEAEKSRRGAARTGTAAARSGADCDRFARVGAADGGATACGGAGGTVPATCHALPPLV